MSGISLDREGCSLYVPYPRARHFVAAGTGRAGDAAAKTKPALFLLKDQDAHLLSRYGSIILRSGLLRSVGIS